MRRILFVKTQHSPSKSTFNHFNLTKYFQYVSNFQHFPVKSWPLNKLSYWFDCWASCQNMATFLVKWWLKSQSKYFSQTWISIDCVYLINDFTGKSYWEKQWTRRGCYMVTLVCTCHNSEMCKIVCNVLQPVLYLANRFLMTFVLINCSEWILGQWSDNKLSEKRKWIPKSVRRVAKRSTRWRRSSA